MKKKQTTSRLKLKKQAIATLQLQSGGINSPEGKTVILITGTKACYPATWVPQSQGPAWECETIA